MRYKMTYILIFIFFVNQRFHILLRVYINRENKIKIFQFENYDSGYQIISGQGPRY